MKRIKFLTVIALVTSICTSSNMVFAQGNILDIDTDIDLALKNSYSIKVQNYSVQTAQSNYTIALDEANKADETLSNNDEMLELKNKPNKTPDEKEKLKKFTPLTENQKESLINTSDIKPLDVKYKLFVVKNSKEVSENTLKLNIYTQYSNLMNLKDMIDSEQKKLDNIQNTNNRVQLQMKLGIVSRVDARKDEVNYINEKSTLVKLQRQMEIAQMNFDQIIGEPISKRYDSFSKDILSDTHKTKTLDEYLISALNNRSEIVNSKEYINTKQQAYNIINNKNPYMVEQAKYDIAEAQNAQDTSKLNIQQQVIQDYNDLTKKVKKIEYVKKSFDVVKKSYNESKLKYNLGMISNNDMENQQLIFKQTENNLKSLERDIWISQLKLEYECGKGINTTDNPTSASQNSD